MKTHPTSIPADARHYEVQGVQRGVFYQFWLTATNGLGEGKPTSILRYKVPSRDEWNDFRRGECLFKMVSCNFESKSYQHKHTDVFQSALHPSSHSSSEARCDLQSEASDGGQIDLRVLRNPEDDSAPLPQPSRLDPKKGVAPYGPVHRYR